MSTGGGSIAPTSVFLPFTIFYSTPNNAVNTSEINFLLVKGSINSLAQGNFALERFTYFQAPVILQTTITNVATVYIEGPTLGGGAAVTNPYALWVTGGTGYARFDNRVSVAQIGGNTQLAGPAVGPSANAGTGATATLSSNATDVAGRITLTTGSAAWASGTQCTIAMGLAALTTTGVCPVLFPANANAAAALNARQVSASPIDIDHWVISFGVADVASTVYVFTYIVGINGT